jgi:hypothetical protein
MVCDQGFEADTDGVGAVASVAIDHVEPHTHSIRDYTLDLRRCAGACSRARQSRCPSRSEPPPWVPARHEAVDHFAPRSRRRRRRKSPGSGRPPSGQALPRGLVLASITARTTRESPRAKDSTRVRVRPRPAVGFAMKLTFIDSFSLRRSRAPRGARTGRAWSIAPAPS